MAILDGLPGEGKPMFGADLATRVSRGWKMPPFPRGEKGWHDPAPCVLVCNEDSWPHTIVPRLTAAEADLTKIVSPGKVLLFPRDLGHLEGMIRRHQARLLIIDPILSCVGNEKTDTNAESHVRQFLQPLLDLTRKRELVTLLVRHFKKEGASAILRGLGSQAWTAVCRLQHVVGDPDDSKRVVLANAKNNLGERPASLGYRIEKATVSGPTVKGRREQFETARVQWVGEVAVSADEVAGAGKRRGRPTDKKDEAVEMIKALLAKGKRMDAGVLQDKVCVELGISAKTFRRAKQQAGVKSRKVGKYQGGCENWI
jgi:hypothetical protein